MKPEIKKQVLILGAIGTAFALLPSTVLTVLCMLPAIVAYVVDRTAQRSQSFCVGVMNFAGTLPFLLLLWHKGNGMQDALEILRHPKTIIVAYAIASTGYLIETAVTGIVSRILIQKSLFRIREIEKRQENLNERWGDTVDGKTPLDDYGFPI